MSIKFEEFGSVMNRPRVLRRSSAAGCDCINIARAIAGSEPTAVHAVAHLHPTGVDDYAAGTLGFGGRTLASFTCGMTVLDALRAQIAPPTRNAAP
jgi:hypothetical protein